MTEQEEFEKEAKKMPKIDMAKVANIDALDAADRKMVNNVAAKTTESDRRKAKKKFNFQEAIRVQLPSGGKFYQDAEDEDLKNGFIKLYPMSLADEEILINKSFIKNGSMFRILFDTCMASNYDARKLLQFDSLYIMYVLRQISYGDDYHFKVTCDDCEEEFDWDLNIGDIDWKELPEDCVDVREIQLPVSKYTVTMSLMRLGMEEQQEIIKKKNAKNPDATDRIVSMVCNTLSIKDENGEEISPEDWIDFYAAIPTKDRNVINESFEGTRQAPQITITCPKCGNLITKDVPIEEDFFRIK